MKCAVIGGAGFIGSHVVEHLLDAEHEVIVIDNFSTGKRDRVEGVGVFDVDIRTAPLKDMLRGVDVVFHLAAQTQLQSSLRDPLYTHDVNVTGTLRVLRAANDAGVRRVVYSASCAAYGLKHPNPVSEECSPSPTVPYAVSKYMGELYMTSFASFFNTETVSLRYFNVYGPRQTTDADGPYATVVGIFLGQRSRGARMTIVGDGKQRRDFVNVFDVARANVMAATSDRVGKGEVVNIGTGESWSIEDVARVIGGEVQYIPARIGDVRDSRADISRAHALLDWSPQISFEYGIDMLKRLHHIDY